MIIIRHTQINEELSVVIRLLSAQIPGDIVYCTAGTSKWKFNNNPRNEIKT